MNERISHHDSYDDCIAITARAVVRELENVNEQQRVTHELRSTEGTDPEYVFGIEGTHLLLKFIENMEAHNMPGSSVVWTELPHKETTPVRRFSLKTPEVTLRGGKSVLGYKIGQTEFFAPENDGGTMVSARVFICNDGKLRCSYGSGSDAGLGRNLPYHSVTTGRMHKRNFGVKHDGSPVALPRFEPLPLEQTLYDIEKMLTVRSA